MQPGDSLNEEGVFWLLSFREELFFQHSPYELQQ